MARDDPRLAADEAWQAADAALPSASGGRRFGRFLVRQGIEEPISATRRYLVKGLITQGEMSLNTGEPGSGKSFLMMHVNWAISQGRSVFGLRVRQAPVLYLGLEGERGMELRIAALVRRFGPAPAFHYIAQPANLFSDQTALDAIREAALATRAACITVDTLSQAFAEGSENDAADSGRMRGNLNELRHATGAHVAVVHHPGKNAALGPRGHSSWLGAADMALEIARTETGERTATLKKLKDGVDHLVLGFNLRGEELGIDQDGDPITTCTVDEVDAPAIAAPAVRLSDEEAGWLADLKRLFDEPDIATRRVSPTSSMQPLRAATRGEIRDWFRRVGRIGVAGGDTLAATDRSTMSRYLNRLKDKGKLGMFEDWIWLVK